MLGPIIIQVAKTGLRLAGKYYAVESKAFSKLYTGFPKSKVIGRGVRHGLVGGSIAGSLIGEGGVETGNGVPTKKLQRRHPSSKPYQTRSGRSRRSRFKCPTNLQSYRYRR